MIEDIEDLYAIDNLISTAKEIYIKTGKPGFILLSVYDALVKKGEIEKIEDQPEELIKAVERRMEYEASKAGTKELKDLAHLRSGSIYSNILEKECKKQVVANYFTVQNEMDNF